MPFLGGRADWEKSGARSWTSSLGTPVTLSQIFQPLNPQTDAEAEAPILWQPDAKNWLTGKDPDTGERLKAGGEGDNRRWDGWLASPTWWKWVWVNSGSWWWTGKSGMLQSMRSQRVGHDWVTELNWTELNHYHYQKPFEQFRISWCRCLSLGCKTKISCFKVSSSLCGYLPTTYTDSHLFQL